MCENPIILDDYVRLRDHLPLNPGWQDTLQTLGWDGIQPVKVIESDDQRQLLTVALPQTKDEAHLEPNKFTWPNEDFVYVAHTPYYSN